MSPIRAVFVGVGAMASLAAPMLIDKEVQIVGAVGRSPGKVGRDAGDVLGLDRQLGVPVEADVAAVLSSRPVDIALVATSSFMADVGAHLAVCARHGVNAITIAEEAIHPWRTSPRISADLDALAIEHGVTLTGGGFQDTYMINLVTTLIGAAHRIDRVVGRSSFNVDEYGPEVARDQQVGRTVEQFEAWLAHADRPPTFGDNILDAIAAASGLTITDCTTTTRPDLATAEIRCESLDLTIEPGRLIGFTDVDTFETAEGPTLTVELSGRIYNAGETDVNDWRVAGDPTMHMVNPDVDTQRATCTQWVNRIPDVINAPAGLTSVDRLPPMRYRPLPLHHYVDRA
jgi:2,4-diaminopentanoate dehydrogenase